MRNVRREQVRRADRHAVERRKNPGFAARHGSQQMTHTADRIMGRFGVAVTWWWLRMLASGVRADSPETIGVEASGRIHIRTVLPNSGGQVAALVYDPKTGCFATALTIEQSAQRLSGAALFDEADEVSDGTIEDMKTRATFGPPPPRSVW